MAEFWWPPREIVFTRKQVLWLLQHLPTIGEGSWPSEPTSYQEPKVQKSRSRHAPFDTPALVAVELETRLEKVGLDGLILEAIECWGKNPQSLASYLRMPVWSIWKRRKNALGYIASGPDRRWHKTKNREPQTYHDFKQGKKTKKSGTKAQLTHKKESKLKNIPPV